MGLQTCGLSQRQKLSRFLPGCCAQMSNAGLQIKNKKDIFLWLEVVCSISLKMEKGTKTKHPNASKWTYYHPYTQPGRQYFP